MEVIEKTLELLDRADFIVDVTKPAQEHDNKRILLAMEDYKKDMEIYGIRVKKSLPAEQLPEHDPINQLFSGHKLVSTSEQFFLTFDDIKFSDETDDKVVSFIQKLHRVKSFKQVKMRLEYKDYPILETENIDEANRVYRKLKERFAYLEQTVIGDLRNKFGQI